MGMLNQIMEYDLPEDYIKDREHFVKGLTLEEHQRLARRYIDPDRMLYLVVGDAATQLEPLKQLGLGEPIVLEVE
jgi:zinc protease